jgi:cytochrome c-type biogenesis protein CcsB
MSPIEAIFFWLTLAFYALTSGGYIYAFVFKHERVLSRLWILVLAGLILHTATIAARYDAQGSLPWAGNYESGLMGGWFIIAFTLYVILRYKPLNGIALATVPFTLLLMGYGVTQNPALSPKAATLKTVWLYIHVYFAWLAFGAFTLAMATGIVYLLKERNEKGGKGTSFYEKIPPLQRLDDLIFKYVVFGFITCAIMIAAGAIWAKDLWGSYWSWDPVETWSLISWLYYGLIIHLRVTFGWRGKRVAWLSIFGIIAPTIAFFGVDFIVKSSIHVFDVVR